LCGADGFALTNEGVELLPQPINVARGNLHIDTRVFGPDLFELLIDFGNSSVCRNPYHYVPVFIGGGYGYGVAHTVKVGFDRYTPNGTLV
jgi:hypothetical protein